MEPRPLPLPLQWGPELGSGIRICSAAVDCLPGEASMGPGIGFRDKYQRCENVIARACASMGPGIGFRDKNALVILEHHQDLASMGPGIGFRDKHAGIIEAFEDPNTASMGPGIGFRDKVYLAAESAFSTEPSALQWGPELGSGIRRCRRRCS